MKKFLLIIFIGIPTVLFSDEFQVFYDNYKFEKTDEEVHLIYLENTSLNITMTLVMDKNDYMVSWISDDFQDIESKYIKVAYRKNDNKIINDLWEVSHEDDKSMIISTTEAANEFIAGCNYLQLSFRFHEKVYTYNFNFVKFNEMFYQKILELMMFEPVLNSFQDNFLKQLNNYRKQNGLVELVYDHRLTLLSKDFSDILASKNTFSHNVITDNEWEILKDVYFIDMPCYELLVFAPKENPPVSECLETLKNSPDHNPALLSLDGKSFGVNYTNKEGFAYVTVYIGR